MLQKLWLLTILLIFPWAHSYAQGPTIYLDGDTLDSIDVFTIWKEPGFVAFDSQQNDISKSVQVESNLDTSDLGCYTVHYKVTDQFGLSDSTHRTIYVVDLSPPELNLIGPSFIRHAHCDSFIDSWYTVTDNYPSGLHVNRSGSWKPEKNGIPGKYRIRYTAIDTGGNIDTISRTILVVDNIPPNIQLIGNRYIRVARFSDYSDSGVVASDSCNASDGLKIVTSGSYVNTESDGIYYLKYHAIDSSANRSDTVVRTINVHHMHDTLSIDNAAEQPVISIFPNPIRAEFQIRLSPEIAPEEVKVLISNSHGSIISTLNLREPTVNSITVQSVHLPPGCYFVTLLVDAKTISRTRLIKL